MSPQGAMYGHFPFRVFSLAMRVLPGPRCEVNFFLFENHLRS